MIIVLFSSRLTAAAGQDYEAMAAEALETARGMPGFVDYKSYRAEDGEKLSVVWWQDEETMAAWRNHPRHRVAQHLGREKWYSEYQIEVAEVRREGAFTA